MTRLKFEPVYKDQLFYGRYKYCMRFRLPEVSALRELDHKRIDSILDLRIENRKDAAKRFSNSAKRYGFANAIPIIHARKWREITEEMRTELHAVADCLINTRIDFKLVISVDLAWVYTNDTSLIKELKTFEVYAKKYSKAEVNRPKNTIILKESPYSFRSYFKTIRLSDTERDVLVTFLEQHQHEIRISPALKAWMEDNYHRTQDYFFVDYNEKTWLTMFGLLHPGLIKKTCAIILNK